MTRALSIGVDFTASCQNCLHELERERDHMLKRAAGRIPVDTRYPGRGA